MSTITATVSDARTTPSLDRVAHGLLLAFVASLQVSIAIADILLALTIAAWVAVLVRDHVRPQWPPFFPALAAYAAITLVASIFSVAPLDSFVDSKQLVLFLIVPVVYDLARRQHARSVSDVIISTGAASAAFGIVQYLLLNYDNLGQRPQGTLTHYMTYSGVLMLALCAASARIVFSTRDRTWPLLIMPALIVALTVTFTRSAWVGACVAMGLLLVLRDFRLTALLPVGIALVFAFAPDAVTTRMMSVFDLQDPTNRDRLAMVHIGTAMIAQHPLTGVGPDMVPRLYAHFRGPDSVEAINPHLHNVPLQIAAERGLPALAIWIGFIVMLARHLWRIFRSGEPRALSAAGLAAIAAMLTAGLFEYNFGDSEFLMLFLVIVTLPFAATRADAAPRDHR
jgi:O-antigen ligase